MNIYMYLQLHVVLFWILKHEYLKRINIPGIKESLVRLYHKSNKYVDKKNKF